MPKPTFRLAAICVSALLFAGAAQAATAVSGSVTQTATAAFTTGTSQTLSRSDSWSGGAIHDLSIGVQAQGTGRGGNDDASGEIQAHWDSANSGTIDYRNHSFQATGINPGPGDEIFRLDTTPDAPDWSYDFTTTAAGVFKFGFDMHSVAIDASGLGSFDLVFGSGPMSQELIPLHDFGADGSNFAASGHVSRQLLAGQTYHVALVSNDHLTVLNPVDGRNATLFADFSWSIAPEPSSWALTILGFGLAGAAIRRRRSLVA